MEPAYSIPLTDKDLATLGELTVILGQIDEEMVQCVSGLVQSNRDTAAKIMGSTQISNNAAIWQALIGQRTKDVDVLWLVAHAVQEIGIVSGGRNDFIHAFFMEASPHGYFTYSSSNEFAEIRPETSAATYAKRIRNSKTTHIAELVTLREKAARLSCLVAHLTQILTSPGDEPWLTPWRDRLLPTLPPRPPNWEPPKARGLESPPSTSGA